MRARTTAVVHPGGVLGALRCEPPLTLRRVHSQRSDTCVLCLVGTGAGPLAGDDLQLDLRVETGARAQLIATGAAVAQGRGGSRSALRWCVQLAVDATLHADPGPLILCEGSRVDVELDIAMAADATLDWQEIVVLGRTTDVRSGTASVRWGVTRAGRPLLRQHLDLSDLRPVGGYRVLGSALLAGPEHRARTIVHGPTAVAQRLDATAVLLTVLGNSAAQVRRELDDLRAAQGRIGTSGDSCAARGPSTKSSV